MLSYYPEAAANAKQVYACGIQFAGQRYATQGQYSTARGIASAPVCWVLTFRSNIDLVDPLAQSRTYSGMHHTRRIRQLPLQRIENYADLRLQVDQSMSAYPCKAELKGSEQRMVVSFGQYDSVTDRHPDHHLPWIGVPDRPLVRAMDPLSSENCSATDFGMSEDWCRNALGLPDDHTKALSGLPTTTNAGMRIAQRSPKGSLTGAALHHHHDNHAVALLISQT